ncbi:MAG: fimbrial protein [Symploca sp. SIO3C6]|uniref:Fimbrial protein n=1 Tax=Symploca sp. SIO1C4 TaxID=2607765 RepID=A0A6B3N4N3_9CYAN|nr:fimbrial protein [Symploca sp. SIO3C6]NER28039.1 fimbrial protein [Symploca sp. SIO1C4]NET04579.1 fimbrial protein [Symploca sp. SIO2B6]
MTVLDTGKCETAKTALRQALAANGGNTKDEAVIAAIDNLTQLNPTTAPARSETLLDSEWLLINAPNFPGGKQLPDGKFTYTLGRLAFNMFQPTQLKLVIDRVLQPVRLLENKQQRSHDIVVEFTTIDESFPKLTGIVHNQGVCHPISDTKLQVKFTGGTLAPQEGTNIKDWQEVFGKQRQSSQKSWQERFISGFFRLMFGLVPPQAMNPDTGEVSFTMNRSPKGSLEILYLDEEMRITRGEKGTLLVCQRY